MVSAHKKTSMLSEWLRMVAVYRKLCVLLDGCMVAVYRKLCVLLDGCMGP
jgi:hypothetical protein